MHDQLVSEKIEQSKIAYQGLRNQLIENLLLNQPNAPLISKTINELIQVERNHAVYDSENWKRVPGL